MTSPFDPNYKPKVDLTQDIRYRKVSETRTRQRAEGMASADPKVRKIAAGTLGNGKLSGRGGRKG